MRLLAHSTTEPVSDRTLPEVGAPASLAVVALVGLLILMAGVVALMVSRR